MKKVETQEIDPQEEYEEEFSGEETEDIEEVEEEEVEEEEDDSEEEEEEDLETESDEEPSDEDTDSLLAGKYKSEAELERATFEARKYLSLATNGNVSLKPTVVLETIEEKEYEYLELQKMISDIGSQDEPTTEPVQEILTGYDPTELQQAEYEYQVLCEEETKLQKAITFDGDDSPEQMKRLSTIQNNKLITQHRYTTALSRSERATAYHAKVEAEKVWALIGVKDPELGRAIQSNPKLKEVVSAFGASRVMTQEYQGLSDERAIEKLVKEVRDYNVFTGKKKRKVVVPRTKSTNVRTVKKRKRKPKTKSEELYSLI